MFLYHVCFIHLDYSLADDQLKITFIFNTTNLFFS